MLTKKPTLRGGGDFETIPEGLYTLQIVDVNEATWEYKGQEKFGFNFKFAILDDEDLPESGESTRGRFLWWRMSDAISKRSNLHKLAAAAFGRKLTDDEQDPRSDDQLNPNDLVGLQIMGSVVNNEDNDGRVWSNIVAAVKAKHKLEPVDYTPAETETKKTVTKPAKKVVEEDDDQGKLNLPDLNPEFDKIVNKKKAEEDNEDEEEEDEDDTPKKVLNKSKKVESDDEDDEEEDAELAELEAAAAKARKRLEAKKLERKSK